MTKKKYTMKESFEKRMRKLLPEEDDFEKFKENIEKICK